MSDQNQRRDAPPMPKVTQLPPPPPQARSNRNTEQVFAEQALRSAQHVIDQAQEIDRIGQELEEWRRRAMLAEADVKRLEQRENELRDMLDRRQTELIDERDSYRGKLNHLVAQFHTAGAIVLKCLEAAQGSAGPQISLTKLADELEREKKPDPDFREVEEGGRRFGADEPMPRAVTAGPRMGDAS